MPVEQGDETGQTKDDLDLKKYSAQQRAKMAETGLLEVLRSPNSRAWLFEHLQAMGFMQSVGSHEVGTHNLAVELFERCSAASRELALIMIQENS